METPLERHWQMAEWIVKEWWRKDIVGTVQVLGYREGHLLENRIAHALAEAEFGLTRPTSAVKG